MPQVPYVSDLELPGPQPHIHVFRIPPGLQDVIKRLVILGDGSIHVEYASRHFVEIKASSGNFQTGMMASMVIDGGLIISAHAVPPGL